MFGVSHSSFKALSSLNSNFSAVFLGSTVIPIFLGGLDLPKWPVLILGLALTISAGLLSMAAAEAAKL